MNNKTLIGIVAGLAVILGIAFYLIPSSNSVGGTVENFPTWFYNGLFAGHTKQFQVSNAGAVTAAGITNTGASTAAGTTTLGASGTPITQLLKGTCSLIGSFSITATTTAAMDCAVSGALAGDTVFYTLATTTPTTNLGWRVVGANASTTAGYLTFKLQNLTGADAVPPITVTSSVQFLDIR